VALLNRLTHLYFPDISRVGRSAIAASHDAHIAIIDAVLAGDEGRTRYRMRTHLEAEAAYLGRRRPSRQLLDATVLRSLDSRSKRGEWVAREIFVSVVESGWPVGAFLGSEADLMEQHGVSRAVLREAVRVLEHHQVAVMRRGPSGGLFVAQPGVDSATGALALLLERRGIEPGDLFELRMALELTIVDLAVQRLTDDRAAALRHAVELEANAPEDVIGEVGHDVHIELAAMVDNPVFELLSLVLIRLTRMHQAQAPGEGPPVAGDVHKAHRAVVEAIADRDSAGGTHASHPSSCAVCKRLRSAARSTAAGAAHLLRTLDDTFVAHPPGSVEPALTEIGA
jgi:DNA-binding FadR family transcriptional regulator